MKKGRGKKNKNKYKCPSCQKPYQSEADLDRHCRNYHGKTLKELREIKEQSRMTLGDFVKGDNADG